MATTAKDTKATASAKDSAKKADTTKAKTAPAATAKSTSFVTPSFFAAAKDDKTAFNEVIAAAEEETKGAKSVGKYEFELGVDGYHFYLSANNGQLLFDSPSFTTLVGAIEGMKTFKKNVLEGEFDIRMDKFKHFRFVLNNKYYGENYDDKSKCKSSVESIKKFASCSKVIPYTPDKEAVAAYEAAKAVKRSEKDVDWAKVKAAEESVTRKMGKFEIDKEEDGAYAFYLLANNGQILYASRAFKDEKAARNGIESFKKAVYVGNFFVDRDKFGRFRYILKNLGSAPAFIGESYLNKSDCEKIIESVKKFVVTAAVVVGD